MKLQFSTIGSIGLPVVKQFMTAAQLGDQFIPFSGSGVGIPTPNVFPQTLADLASNAPTHGAAIEKKATLTFGQGVDFSELTDNVRALLNSINKDDESINDIVYKVSYDLVTYGGFSLKVKWNFDRTISDIYHVPFKNVRMGIPVEGEVLNYIISNNWDRQLHRQLEYFRSIPAFNPEKINTESVEVDVDSNTITADEETLANGEQLIYYKAYSTASNGFYPVPDYASCIDAAFTEVEVGIAMIKTIENGLDGPVIISNADDAQVSDENKQEIIDTFNSLAAGAANAGGMIYVPSNIKVEQVQSAKADKYEAINPEVRQRIISAHGIPSILVEYSQGGGFNNRAEETKVALQIFQQTLIKGYQNQISKVFNDKVMPYMVSEQVEIKIAPFSIDFTDEALIQEDVEVEVNEINE